MRRKISKRKRREILARGGIFRNEGWFYTYSIEGKKQRSGYEAHVQSNGWVILAGGRDELEAYKAVLNEMEWCEANPRTPENDHIIINGHDVPVTGVMTL